MTRCLIALGGNIGVSETVFEAAMSQLQRPGIDLIRVAKTLKTRPVGASAGEEFLNTAATLETSLDPQELLSALHEVENAFGRTRTIHWGPRTLDLDLCLFGDEIIDSNMLVIPHPAMWYRRFVIDPALDVAAEMQHPLLKQSIRELHRELHQCPLKIAISDSETNPAMSVCSAVLKEAHHLDPAIEWLVPPNSPNSSENCFAQIVIERRPESIPQRIQPKQESSRVIRVSATSDADAMNQLKQLTAAILG